MHLVTLVGSIFASIGLFMQANGLDGAVPLRFAAVCMLLASLYWALLQLFPKAAKKPEKQQPAFEVYEVKRKKP